ncbi:hypothetical protein BpHYR1_024352 [Brachionus plicatilis]|uniref:Uncharacterized protein n=1 Tax=Brachionus plicatilis TaxID=10195 RepID=A0A3M7QBD8_BRAPC|nr:hypothetical protein BpHYR1_024352 [Brachionus plicatilis]
MDIYMPRQPFYAYKHIRFFLKLLIKLRSGVNRSFMNRGTSLLINLKLELELRIDFFVIINSWNLELKLQKIEKK